MSFETHFDRAQKLVIFTNHGAVSEADLTRALELFRKPDFPITYDLISRFEPGVVLKVGHEFMVQHAIERQRVLNERPTHTMIRSAIVGAPEPMQRLLELWPTFFPATDGMLNIKLFQTLDEALVWLDRAPIVDADLELYAPLS